MATWEPVFGAATSTVRDWLGEVGIVVLIAFTGVVLAAVVALTPWPVLDDPDPAAPPPGTGAPAQAGR